MFFNSAAFVKYEAFLASTLKGKELSHKDRNMPQAIQ